MENELIQPMYYNVEKLLKPPAPIYRTELRGDRFYYSLDDNGNMKKYPSVTTVLGSVMPQSEYLVKWISELGYAKAMQKKHELAAYGTMLHVCIADYLLKKRFNFDELPLRIQMEKYRSNLNFDTGYWEASLAKDLYSFHVFAIDYQVVPIAIEIMLMSDILKVAGAIDLALEITVGSGTNMKILKSDYVVAPNGTVKVDKRKKILAILDVKSGKKGFYPNHEAQLHMYDQMWQENFPHLPTQAIFNWAPAEWETEPSYHLKEQSSSMEKDCIKDYIHIYNRKFNKADQKYPFISGTIEYGKLNGNLQLETFREHLTRLGKFKGMQPQEEIIEEGFNVVPPTELKVESNKVESGKKKAKSNVVMMPEIKATPGSAMDMLQKAVQKAEEKIQEPTVKLHSMTIDGKNVEFDTETGEVITEPIPDETPLKFVETPANEPENKLEMLLNNFKGKTA